MIHRAPTLNYAWREQLSHIMMAGHQVQPRGMDTLEMIQKTLVFDMQYPVVVDPNRKLGYKFMCAEAWWLLSGRSDVAGIAPYSKAISQFSDDGIAFFGSYGPPFVSQLTYVVDTLMKDADTRQATMTFWRQNPPKTKDVPCTVAIDFKIRDGRIHTQVFMRSSDNWLGVPYDAFNFTMMTCRVLELLNPQLENKLRLGNLSLTAASSHLYARDFPAVDKLLKTPRGDIPQRPVPKWLYGVCDNPQHQPMLIDHLEKAKDSEPEDRRLRFWLV